MGMREETGMIRAEITSWLLDDQKKIHMTNIAIMRENGLERATTRLSSIDSL